MNLFGFQKIFAELCVEVVFWSLSRRNIRYSGGLGQGLVFELNGFRRDLMVNNRYWETRLFV